MERNVVITRHYDLRLRQFIKKRSRLQELVGTRTLSKVTRDRDQIRFNFLNIAISGLMIARSTRPKCRSERWTIERISGSIQLQGRGQIHARRLDELGNEEVVP